MAPRKDRQADAHQSRGNKPDGYVPRNVQQTQTPPPPIPRLGDMPPIPGDDPAKQVRQNPIDIAVEPREPLMTDDALTAFTRGRRIGLGVLDTPSRGRPGNLLLIEAPSGELDGFLIEAAKATAKSFGGMETVDDVNEMLLRAGLSEQVARLSDRLHRAALERSTRLLLSFPGVYASLVKEAMDKEIPFKDTAGLYGYVLRSVEDTKGGPGAAFATHVVDGALAEKHIKLSETERKLVIEEVRNTGIPLKASKAIGHVLRIVENVASKALPRAAVDWFATREEIDEKRFTEAVKRSMTDYLADLGVRFNATDFENGKFDEYLAIAYNHAIRNTNGGTADPIDVVRRRGAVVDWNFRVESFDTVEEQGVVPDNIRAAGALDYLYQLGDRMGIYRLLDAFTLAWGRGDFDLEHMPLPAPNTEDVQALMFRYHKLRIERVSPEERATLYRRVLDKGTGKLLGGTQPNRAFTTLWRKLMTEMADYIRRREESPARRTPISRQRVYEAMRQLQINLSERMAGMARLQVTEMYHQFLEAKAILESEQMLDYYGAGPRRSIWTVIERGKRELLEEQDNLSALLTAAVEGNKVFQLLADFEPASFTEAQFDALADACEAVIIAESVLSGTAEEKEDEQTEELEDVEEEIDEELAGWDD